MVKEYNAHHDSVTQIIFNGFYLISGSLDGILKFFYVKKDRGRNSNMVVTLISRQLVIIINPSSKYLLKLIIYFHTVRYLLSFK